MRDNSNGLGDALQPWVSFESILFGEHSSRFGCSVLCCVEKKKKRLFCFVWFGGVFCFFFFCVFPPKLWFCGRERGEQMEVSKVLVMGTLFVWFELIYVQRHPLLPHHHCNVVTLPRHAILAHLCHALPPSLSFLTKRKLNDKG